VSIALKLHNRTATLQVPKVLGPTLVKAEGGDEGRVGNSASLAARKVLEDFASYILVSKLKLDWNHSKEVLGWNLEKMNSSRASGQSPNPEFSDLQH
jgi:hypothetical protein